MFMVSSNTIVDYQWPIKPAKIPSSQPSPAQPSPAQHPATCIGKNIGNKNKGEVLSIGDHLTQLLRASSVVGRGWLLTLGSWDDGVTRSWQDCDRSVTPWRMTRRAARPSHWWGTTTQWSSTRRRSSADPSQPLHPQVISPLTLIIQIFFNLSKYF